VAIITRVLVLLGSVLLLTSTGTVTSSMHAAAVMPPQAQAPAAGQATVSSPMTVTVPQEDAELLVEGQSINGEGSTRTFPSPPLHPGDTYTYTFTAKWAPNTYTTMTRSRTVSFRAGEPVTLDLTVEDPSDRVRVIYVPTPDDVAAEMVKLAGVTTSDIAFEPGCGDARITIAAVKGGAKRGIGIDIDPERVEESRANVKAAGLENRIDIRLGDALDIRDLSAATVVFLYMGDHFNMLIRPILWRDLPVGARVVSHRFTMGDWEPDKTVTVTSNEGGEYDLHLWVITDDVKRRMARGAGDRTRRP
jgi:uncharacterized protein (TIGR03000 family)